MLLAGATPDPHRGKEQEPMKAPEPLPVFEFSAEEMEQAEKKKEKKSLFNPFANRSNDEEGVDKDAEIIAENPNLKNFFVLVGRKLNQILTVNLMMVAGNFPIFFALFVIGGYLSVHTTSPYYLAFAPLRSVIMFDHSPATSALWSIFSRQASVTILTTGDYILLGLAALVILTFGPVRVGVTYIHRNIVRGEPVFLWHDFWYCIKRNLRQSFIYGIMDVLISGLIIYDILFFNLNYGSGTMTDIMFFMSLMLGLIYAFMRIYIYLMLITFDLSIFKMFKNALYFTVLGVKRNFLAFLGIVLVLMINYLLLAVFFPLGVILPLVIVPSLCILMGIYAAFPKIKEIMIDPYYAKTNAEIDEEL
jgi:uncharacterized membrane protein YesL